MAVKKEKKLTPPEGILPLGDSTGPENQDSAEGFTSPVLMGSIPYEATAKFPCVDIELWREEGESLPWRGVARIEVSVIATAQGRTLVEACQATQKAVDRRFRIIMQVFFRRECHRNLDPAWDSEFHQLYQEGKNIPYSPVPTFPPEQIHLYPVFNKGKVAGWVAKTLLYGSSTYGRGETPDAAYYEVVKSLDAQAREALGRLLDYEKRIRDLESRVGSLEVHTGMEED